MYRSIKLLNTKGSSISSTHWPIFQDGNIVLSPNDLCNEKTVFTLVSLQTHLCCLRKAFFHFLGLEKRSSNLNVKS